MQVLAVPNSRGPLVANEARERARRAAVVGFLGGVLDFLPDVAGHVAADLTVFAAHPPTTLQLERARREQEHRQRPRAAVPAADQARVVRLVRIRAHAHFAEQLRMIAEGHEVERGVRAG